MAEKPLAEVAIYAIRHTTELDAAHRDGGSGTFTEGRRWVTGRKLLLRAREQGNVLPVLFAPAETTDRLIYHATLDDILLGVGDAPATTYRFSGLTPIAHPLPLSSLLVISSGLPLPDTFIRSYVLCRTPAFLAGGAGLR